MTNQPAENLSLDTHLGKLLNKLINTTSDTETLQLRLNDVFRVMTNSDPSDDLEQDTLELIIFEAKAKLKTNRDKFEVTKKELEKNLNSTNTSLTELSFLQTNLKNTTEKYNQHEEDCKDLIKKIAATSLKWEVGASEVIKTLQSEIKNIKKHVADIVNTFERVVEGVKEYMDTIKEDFDQTKNDFAILNEKINILSKTTVTIEALNEFKYDLSNFLSKEKQTNSKIINFN